MTKQLAKFQSPDSAGEEEFYGVGPQKELLAILSRTSFPSRGAASKLQDSVRGYLRSAGPSEGSVFPTDPEVADASRLSRSTVWRALNVLQREGWLKRVPGRGSFVGPKAVGLAVNANRSAASSLSHSSVMTRICFLISNAGDFSFQWFAPLIIRGIQSLADEMGQHTELITQDECDVEAYLRRIRMSNPDVLISLPFGTRQGLSARDLEPAGVPVLFAGRQSDWADIPWVCIDNRQGMALAVRHLHEAGHKRVGLIMNSESAPWVIDRCRSFSETVQRLGMDQDGGLVHWTDVPHHNQDEAKPGRLREEADRLSAYLERSRPTAVICGSSPVARVVSLLCRQGRLSVPQDISVLTFDQNPLVEAWFGKPIDAVELPLFEIGRRLAVMADAIREGREVPGETLLRCSIKSGRSVRQINSVEA